MTSKILCLVAILLVSGCTTAQPVERADVKVSVEPPPQPQLPEWRTIAKKEDQSAIDALGARWASALAAVKTWRKPAVTAEGKLLEADAALVRPLPPPGRYRCRTLRFAGTQGGFQSFQPWFCFVEEEGDLTILTKATGSDRPQGRLWPDGEKRLIFLGSTLRGPEGPAPAYGDSRDTDTAGVCERVGDFQWRLVVPRAGNDLDIIELVPDVPPPSPPASWR